jgi:hypothetical protein
MVAAIGAHRHPAAERAARSDMIRRLAGGAFPVPADATAYPGNSGSPLYVPDTAEVVGVVNMVFVKRTKEAAPRSERISYDPEPVSDRARGRARVEEP